MVVDRGLEPTILCVRGRPPGHLEESTINKAPNYCKMGIEPIYFSWKENVITVRLFAKEFAVRAFSVRFSAKKAVERHTGFEPVHSACGGKYKI